MMYIKLHPTNVAAHWVKVAPWIAQAIAEWDVKGPQELDFIFEASSRGAMHIWIGQKDNEIQVVFVTEAIISGGEPVLVVRWLTGMQVDEWVEDIAAVESWARSEGFRRLEVWGRKGWEKKLRKHGFAHEVAILSKRIYSGVH